MPVRAGQHRDSELGPRPDPPPRPGWYPDPRELDDPDPEPAYRWWDGTGWTAWLADSPYAASPRGVVPRVEPRAEIRKPRSARWLVAVLALASLLLGLAALSIHGRSLPQAVPEAATPSSLGMPQRQVLAWTTRDRKVIIAEKLEMELAAGLAPSPVVKSITGFLDNCSVASGQQGVSDDQYPQQVLGSIDPATLVPGDSVATALQAYQKVQKLPGSSGDLQWSQPRTEPWPGIPGATRLTAELRYPASAGLVPEQITVITLPWQQGRLSGMGLWLTLVPVNASVEARAALAASERSIRLVT